MPPRTTATKEAIRAARLAPLAALRSPTVTERGLRNALVALPARGMCAELVRRMSLSRYSAKARAAALRSPSCPPGVIRAASAANRDLQDAAADAAGTAAWRSRSRRETLPPHKPHDDYTATGPGTPPATLRWLGLHGDVYGNRLGMVMDPACPPVLLTGVSEEISADWDWVTSEDPHEPKWPAAAVAVFASSLFSNRRRAAAEEPACPAVALRHLAADDDRDVRIAAAANPACPPAQVATAAEASDFELNAAACKNPALPPDAQTRLAATGDPRTRSMTAANASCSPRLLEQLARDPSAAVRAAAAGNPALPAAALTELATSDPDRKVRLAAHTQHPPTTEILHSAARDSSRKIRAVALAHPDCAPEELAHAAASTHQPTRAAALAHPNCPPETLSAAARSDNHLARSVALNHLNCPLEALTAAAASDDQDIRAAALAHTGCPRTAITQAAAHPDPDTKIRALRHPACPHTVLEAAARSSEQLDRRAVASRESCPPRILAAVVHSETGPDPVSVMVPPPDRRDDIGFRRFCGDMFLGRVRFDDDTSEWIVAPTSAQMALSHKNCPPEVLGAAVRNTRHRFFGPAAGNPACPPDDLADAVTRWGFDGPYLAVQAAVANPACPPHILAAAAVYTPARHEPEPHINWVRRITAANPACPPSTLEQLAKDSDHKTATTAITNPNFPAQAHAGAVLALFR